MRGGGWAVVPRNAYPPDWQAIARAAKEAAGWHCVRCGHEHSRLGWFILTVHHLDGDKNNCRWWNLLPLCQRCHLSIQARVCPDQPYVFEHSAWFKPYVAGFYAWKYLREDLTREQAEARLDELLALERIA
jgi:hypothetical protein